ncbi:spherulation-specific family 4 protein, partial [Streptomyces sp. NPDC058398]|uniref:spherulation-specific family 4 protein n=1 Tax=Streptomyces sp. NPDC058398 TaxID=3346479 RepID=UPI003649AC8B
MDGHDGVRSHPAGRRRTNPMSLLIPLYVHPGHDPGAWQRLTETADRTYGVVINPADGPGEGPDPAFAAAADALCSAGARLLGYVDT